MEEMEKETTTVETDYISKLQELKANSVSLDEYNRVRADNKRMLDAMFSGASIQQEQPKKEEEVDIQALRDELYGGRFEGTDLDYVSKTLKLRKALMDRGEPDPAVSNGAKTIATEADYQLCNDVCEAL